MGEAPVLQDEDLGTARPLFEAAAPGPHLSPHCQLGPRGRATSLALELAASELRVRGHLAAAEGREAD